MRIRWVAIMFLVPVSFGFTGEKSVALTDWNSIQIVLEAVKENDKNTLREIELLATRMNEFAMTAMGMIKQNEGVQENSQEKFIEAEEWLSRAIRVSSPFAYYTLGIMYESGHAEIPYWIKKKYPGAGVFEIKDLASLEFYKIAFYKTESLIDLDPDRNDREVLEKFSSTLANMIATKLPQTFVHVDDTESQKWHFIAAEKGDTKSMIVVAEILTGIRTGNSMARGFEFFQKAADLGDAIAQERLGDMYEYGHGTPKDVKKSEEWFGRAIQGGNERASEKLRMLRLEYAELTDE